MPAPAVAMLSLLMLAPSPGQGIPEIHQVACRVIIDGVCRVDAIKGGDGGKGGNAVVNYNFYLGGPQGGSGGDGATVKSGLPVPTRSNAVAPTASPSVAIGAPVSLTLPRCKLTIAGKAEVDAKSCKYEKVAQQFTLTAPSENQKYVYNIKVAFNEDKSGQGFLSGGRTQATRSLGRLMRRGACWVSEDSSVEICAWK